MVRVEESCRELLGVVESCPELQRVIHSSRVWSDKESDKKLKIFREL